MSIEQLLFFLLLLALPLFERLIRLIRERAGGSPGERDPAPAGDAGSRPPPPVPAAGAGTTAPPRRRPPLPDLPLPPALPQTVRPAAPEQHRPSEHGPRLRRERSPAPAASRQAGRPVRSIALGRSIAGGDLRRAIVTMAIFGPCRALDSKDQSH